MKKFTGKGVYGAIAMGKISVFQKQDTLIQRTSAVSYTHLTLPTTLGV